MEQRTLLIATIYFCFPLTSVSQNSQLDTAKLLLTINQIADKYHVPDVAVAITQNDSTIFRFDKNVKNKNKNYLIGSCSKSFTALTILSLADKGLINIDAPVKKYLPWFTLKDTTPVNQITLRHLLNQTSGIDREYGYFDYDSNNLSIYESKLSEYLKSVPSISLTGNAFHYSNLNYLLLGLIIHRVMTENYATGLSKDIFLKVGMPNTFADFNNTQAHNLIQPYQYFFYSFPAKSKTYTYSDFSVPYGRISSNTNDLCKYLNCIVHQSITLNEDTLLSIKNYEPLITPAFDNYAMGWVQNKYYGTSFINHLGLNENYSSALAICPERKMGIVVLSNINSFEFCNEIQYAILSQVIAKPYTPAMSQELLRRKAIGFGIVFLFFSFLYNLFRWKKCFFKFELTTKKIPLVRLIIGIILSTIGLCLIPKLNSIPFGALLNYQPDFGYGLIVIAVIGIASSLIRNFGSYNKFKR